MELLGADVPLWAMAAAALAAAAAIAWVWSSRPASGFGSGNNPWFRHIDSTPRRHQTKHHKLEHVWEYRGRGVKHEPAAGGFVDEVTKQVVNGPLLGRQTWRPMKGTREDVLRRLQPEDDSFDPAANPVSSAVRQRRKRAFPAATATRTSLCHGIASRSEPRAIARSMRRTRSSVTRCGPARGTAAPPKSPWTPVPPSATPSARESTT